MKKLNNNNKFRGNNGNTIYSLNYKFDSVSVAGKCSGTALDLIKKYNELAKEAHCNGDYVAMEVFRQYAEHYRKIVTEINERKNQNRDAQNNNQNVSSENTENTENLQPQNNLVETESASAPATSSQSNEKSEQPEQPTSTAETHENKPFRRHRSFTVVEVAEKTENLNENSADNSQN